MDTIDQKVTRRRVLATGAGIAGLGAAATLVSGTTPALAHTVQGSPISEITSLPVKTIERIFNVKGTLLPGGVLSFDLDREDLHPTVFGIPLEVDLGFDTEITFQPLAHDAIVKWEMALLDSEVNPVVDALLNQKLYPVTTSVNAIHNHFVGLDPQVKFVHGTAIGDAVRITQVLHAALQQSHQPFVTSAPGNTHLPNQEITRIIGGSSTISGSVLAVNVDRKETFRELGIELNPAMLLASNFHFQAFPDGKAAVNVELTLLPSEVDAVTRSQYKQGFTVAAIHNHELFIQPQLYYLHTLATGDPLALARSIRLTLEKTNSKFH